MTKDSKALRYARRYIAFVAKRPVTLLLIYVLLSGASVVAAKTFMDIRTDLESLLPQGTPSVAALDESRARRGSTDFYTIAIKSPDPEANAKFVDAVAAEVRNWEETRFVRTERDTSFFADHALLYLPKEDLTRLRDNLATEVKLEKKLNNPFFVDIRTKEEVDAANKERWKEERWLAPDLATRLGLDKDLFASIVDPSQFGLEAKEDPGTEKPKEAAAPEKPPEPELPEHLRARLMSPNGQVAVVLAQLSQPATDVVKSKELMERGTAVIDNLDPKKFHPEMEARVAGAYRNFKEVEDISNDSTIAAIASTVLVILVVLLFFRNGRSLLLLIVPLAIGVTWSIGLTALTYGRLNISTLFVFSMLIGMGIDFGIHYYARVMEEFRAGETLEEALARSVQHTGRAMVSAALTTCAALLTLTAASFRGFVEFGIIASYGIALCLVAVILVMPALVMALEKIWATKRPSVNAKPPAALTAGGVKRARMFGVAFIVLGLLGGSFAVMNWDKAQFEHDFRNLRGKKTKTGISYGSAVGKGKSTSPALILGDSVEQMREVHETLSRRFNETKGGEGSYLKSFVTIQTYVPPEQAQRMEVIQEINELVSDPKLKRSKGKARKLIDRMNTLSKVKPFTVKEIPEWAAESLTEKDGTVGRLGFLYSHVKKWDATDVQAFQDELGTIKTPSGDVPVASSGFIVSDVVRTVKSDALRLMPIIFAVLAVILLIDLRSFKGGLICLLSMGLALVWTVGGMIIFDIRLGLYNMINLPMILGTGIDGSIHLYHRYKELGEARMPEVLKSTGGAVIASSMTTLAGFAGLLFVDHLGVKSIGTLATAGIGATLVAVFLFMPGLMMLLVRTKKAGSEESG
jgi:uncharacterized protein